ncbi:MAG: aldo/keto reductase [Rikenellaceae bacterium]
MNREYIAAEDRYTKMSYARAGRSGILLPRISLGLWHNFGSECDMSLAADMITTAFDRGVTHFDLANNYGPRPGSAEQNFGRILKKLMPQHRDELIISTKAGHEMWPGPYGDNCSRKGLLASLDQSLGRMGLEYVDIFYTHRYDGVTPLEETASALTTAVRSGKALYAGISKYPPVQAREIYRLLREAGTPCLLSQYRYSLFERSIEAESLALAAEEGSGFIAFSSLAQGLLSDKYINGIPEGSRAAGSSPFLNSSHITPEKIAKVKQLNALAQERGESLAQMALQWTLRDERVSSLIVGASSVQQLNDNLDALSFAPLSGEELARIEDIML